MTAALDVTHHADDHRYVLTDGDEAVGLLAYRPVGRPGADLVDVYTTQISPARRGQGLGEVLVREALDDLRRQGTAVKASCWYVADFLRDNPRVGRRLRKQGRRVHVWTVNEPADLDLCADLGVEAVITDRPAAALAHLRARRDAGGAAP